MAGPNVLNISQGFTPNGDGINDTWHIENIDNYPNAKITVYSRWGREVFLSNGNYTNNWNGTYNGGPLPDAAYLYIIDLENDGKAQKRWLSPQKVSEPAEATVAAPLFPSTCSGNRCGRLNPKRWLSQKRWLSLSKPPLLPHCSLLLKKTLTSSQ